MSADAPAHRTSFIKAGDFVTPFSRLAALGVAACASFGLGLQLWLDVGNQSIVAALLAEAAYFTILTNVLVAVVFLMLALGAQFARSSPKLAALSLSIMLVGIIYHVLLAKLYHLTGLAVVSNLFLHGVTPIVAPAYWAVFAPKGRLRWIDPLIWAVYPIVYFAYALIRGAVTGFYPYPFINLPKIGLLALITNAAFIAIGFLAVAYVVVWIDHVVAWRARRELG